MEYLELKPGWIIRVPPGMNMMQLARYRFDPVTLAIIAVSVAGGLQAVSQVQQGKAARAQGEAQAAIANRNAILAERQAAAEKTAAAEAAKAQTREGEELLARQRALFAKGGVVAKGTPLSVIADTATTLEADRLTLLREGAVRASQATGQADVFRLQGSAAKAKGRAASRASKLAAAGTILSTVGTAGTLSSLRPTTTPTSNFGSPVIRAGRNV